MSKSLIRGTGAVSRRRKRRGHPPTALAISTTALAVARTLTIKTGTRTLGALRVTGSRGWSADFDAGVDRAVAAGFGVEHGFGLGLSLFEFEFFGVFFAFRMGSFGGMRFSRIGDRRLMDLSNSLAGIAIQVSGAGLGFFFEFFVTFIGRSFVMDGAGFFFVDGLFFHRPGSGENRSLLCAWAQAIGGFGQRSGIVVSRDFLFLDFFVLDFLFWLDRLGLDRCRRLTRPSERRHTGGFRTAEFLIPIGRG